MNCAYCKKGFSCGCQKTKASNGETVHKTCLNDYNKNKLNTNTKSSNSLTDRVKTAKKNLYN